MSYNKLSIIIISRSNHNLQKLIESIEEASVGINYELLISWNGEDECIYSKRDAVSVHKVVPYNFSKNNNFLAQKSSSDLLLFLNDDIELDPNSISNAVDFFISRQDVGGLGINLRYPNGNIQHGGMFLRNQDEPYHIYKNSINYLDSRVRSIYECDAVTGAFVLMWRADFLSVGGFDERCDVAAQDVILSIKVREQLHKKIIYYGYSTAIHYENVTRKMFDQKTTPKNDVVLMKNTINSFMNGMPDSTDDIRLRIVTEKPGWILYRKAEEIAKRLVNSRINEDYEDANIHYYINYGYFNKRPPRGVVVANFTHYDPSLHADKWISVAKEVDHCTAVSEEAKFNLLKFGIPAEKISVIKVGADVSYKPKLTLGIVGRVYGSGRKGEHLIKGLLSNAELMQDMQIVSTSEGWGVPVWSFADSADFYRSIDFLLIPSLIEGGPVPFMEALACGVLSVAPPIGVVPEFPHIEYKTGDLESLIQVISEVKKSHLEDKTRVSRVMSPYNWGTWASEHISLFKNLLRLR